VKNGEICGMGTAKAEWEAEKSLIWTFPI